MVLVLALLAAAVLLVFWRGMPATPQSGDGSPVQEPEVVLRPLPQDAKPVESGPQEAPAPPAAKDSEKAPLPPAGNQGVPVEQPPARVQEVRTVAKTVPTPQPIKPQYRKARLFFAAVDAEGRIAMKSVIRPVPIGDSPLLDTMQSLLAGPTPQEINLGMLSMIPVGSRLISAAMKRDVAVLDFNETFRYNRLGVEGQMAQLRQVVYAATEFANVKKVQILIDGKKVDFLGTEGIPIGKPLDRESLGQ